jgi:hypothetical protein
MKKMKKGNIQVTKDGNFLVVEDVVDGFMYKVEANEKGINTLGMPNSLWTWGQAFDEGRIVIMNDDIDCPGGGHSWGDHGSIYIEEED